jgi:hypothetical protein
MWPGNPRPDEYDLKIIIALPGKRVQILRVDAKAWESVGALAYHHSSVPTAGEHQNLATWELGQLGVPGLSKHLRDRDGLMDA